MSNDLNQCNFIGRLAKEPEVRAMQSGDNVTSFTIAVGSSWKSKQTGEKQESTEWINIVCFKGLASVAGSYLHKGDKVFISGNMKTRKYTDKQGVDKYITEIVAKDLQMLGSKPNQEGGSNDGADAAQKPQKQEQENQESDDIPF